MREEKGRLIRVIKTNAGANKYLLLPASAEAVVVNWQGTDKALVGS